MKSHDDKDDIFFVTSNPAVLRRVRQDEIDPLVTGRVSALMQVLAGDGAFGSSVWIR